MIEIKRRRVIPTWRKAITTAAMVPAADNAYHASLHSDSSNWCCCAVGSILDPPISDKYVNRVIGDVLKVHYKEVFNLGCDFYEQIKWKEYKVAAHINEQIIGWLTPVRVQGIRRKVNECWPGSAAVWPDVAVGAGESTLGRQAPPSHVGTNAASRPEPAAAGRCPP